MSTINKMCKQVFEMFERGNTIFDRNSINKSWGWADFGNGLIVHDKDVYKLMKQHLRLRDRFNLKKIVLGTFYSFDILCGAVDKPKGKWYW